MSPFLAFCAVALGSAAGGVARVWAAGCLDRRLGEGFPWGTLAVNLSGAFLLGLLAPGLARVGEGWGLLLAVGFLGSYTTVSSLSLQTLALWQAGRAVATAAYLSASLLLGLAAAAAGFGFGLRLWGAV